MHLARLGFSTGFVLRTNSNNTITVRSQVRCFAKKGKTEEAQDEAAKSTKAVASAETRKLRALEIEMSRAARTQTTGIKKNSKRPFEIFQLRRTELYENVGPAGHRPHLSQAARDEMFRLHTTEPEKYTEEVLSEKYGIRKARVRAIITLKELEKQARERGDWVAPDDRIDEGIAGLFGSVDVRNDDEETPDEMPTRHAPSFLEDSEDERQGVKALHYKKASEPEIPRRPAPEDNWPEVPVVLRAPTATERKRVYRSKYIAYDVDRHVKDDAHKLMVVADQYGVVRTPTWDERRYVLEPQRRSRNTAGGVQFLAYGEAKKLSLQRQDRDRIIDMIGLERWARESVIRSPEMMRKKYLNESKPYPTLMFEDDMLEKPPMPKDQTWEKRVSRKQAKLAKAAAAPPAAAAEGAAEAEAPAAAEAAPAPAQA